MKLLMSKPDYKKHIKPDIERLHVSRTKNWFFFLSLYTIDKWVSKFLEKEYASWFAATYLAEGWNRWFVGSTDAGLNNNAQESYHHWHIKVCKYACYRN